jgi:hypothetical protein
MDNKFERGSEWRQWNLHVHTPASFHWNGPRFTGDPEADTVIVDQMIGAMSDATPAVFALMDYWTFDGWFALQTRLKDPEAPKLRKTVFPGIELRLNAPRITYVSGPIEHPDTNRHVVNVLEGAQSGRSITDALNITSRCDEPF